MYIFLVLIYHICQPSHSAIFSLECIQHCDFRVLRLLIMLLIYIYIYDIILYWCYIICTFLKNLFQTQSLKTFTIQVLADSALEGEESFNVRLFPAQTDAVIDPVRGQFLHTPYTV